MARPPRLRPLRRRGAFPLRKLVAASVLTIVATALLVFGVALISASRSDTASQERQVRTVASALAKAVKKIPFDQESVAIWDDAIVKLREPVLDLTWVEDNLGVWMHEYFKHDQIFIIDSKGAHVYAMADGETIAGAAADIDPAVQDAITQLRAQISNGALDAYELNDAPFPRVADYAVVAGRPAITSVVPLVPETEAVTQERGQEYMFAAVRFLDRSFLLDLGETYLLDGVRFSPRDDKAGDENSFPLTSSAGVTIGHIVWKPELPGRNILADITPVIAVCLMAIAVAMAFLIQKLRRIYSELVVSEAHSKHRAFHDALTGLPNRTCFNTKLGRELRELRTSHGNGHQLALMFLDLDRFKHVNDTLGHPAGDALIRQVAARISAALEPDDLFARMGGDEFAIVKCPVGSRDEVEALCQDVIAAVSAPFEVHGQQAVVGISIGVAMAPDAGVDRSELARKADIALYQAKNGGGLGFEFFTEQMSAVLQERRTLEAELRRALDEGGQLEVVYQPQFCARDLKVAGVEALVRWDHPRLGVVAPPVFIAVAEECNLIDRLGEWVLREACRAARHWDVGTLAVNVSPIQCKNLRFAERVLSILKETGMDPTRLEIEITENTLLDSSGTSARVLRLLRSAGVRVALDDFGTGYSSLGYLIKLEVDHLKIDRSFVHHIWPDSRAASIVEAIVTMAHAVGVPVTAEGVETPAQREFLTRISCDTLQGYLLSRPLSALGLTEKLANGFTITLQAEHKAA